MAFVGGFLGGGVEMVPAGHMQVILQWNTEDRLNIEGAVFKLTGSSSTYVANGDETGRAEIIVPCDEYEIEVQHSGVYSNDSPQRIKGESSQTYLVLFDAYVRGTGLTLNGYALFGATYEIVSGEETIISGEGWSSRMVFQIPAGEYIVRIHAYGDSVEIPITVIIGVNNEIDISDYFCKISFQNLMIGTIVEYQGAPIGAVQYFYVIKSSESKNITYQTPEYSNGVRIASGTSTVIPDLVERTVNVVLTGTINLITENIAEFRTPIDGTYEILVIGGGGSGGGYRYYNSDSDTGNYMGGGGGGGRVATTTTTLSSKESYSITIGEGGTPIADDSPSSKSVGGNAGGPTSFDTLLSAAGGDGGGGTPYSDTTSAVADGGAGGSGGGGGAARIYATNWDNYRYGGKGGAGEYGGGGGGGTSYGGTTTSGGAGGTFGGAGGRGGYGTTSTLSGYMPQAGSNGTDGPVGTIFEGSAEGGAAGAYPDTSCGGGGGGGGYGAAGGAGDGGSVNYGGGGGGGGVHGGRGGDGGLEGGYGYGAGGRGHNFDSTRTGGGGGGGYGSTKIADRSGAKGCVVIQWRS